MTRILLFIIILLINLNMIIFMKYMIIQEKKKRCFGLSILEAWSLKLEARAELQKSVCLSSCKSATPNCHLAQSHMPCCFSQWFQFPNHTTLWCHLVVSDSVTVVVWYFGHWSYDILSTMCLVSSIRCIMHVLFYILINPRNIFVFWPFHFNYD